MGGVHTTSPTANTSGGNAGMNGLSETISRHDKPPTVLVVDSDTRALGLSVSHLEYRIAGATVLKANSQAEARSCLAYRKADFIVLDCEGSIGDWNQLLSALTLLCPEAKVVLTGRSPMSVREQPGVLGFLRKPYLVDDLIALITSERDPKSRCKTNSTETRGQIVDE
jgi:DNA-binding NtrC family response regulator